MVLEKAEPHYANLYASENEIVAGIVLHPSDLASAVVKSNQKGPIGVVLVDDLIGTGRSLASNFSLLSESLEEAQIGIEIPLVVVVRLWHRLGRKTCTIAVRIICQTLTYEICELLENKHFAFSKSNGFWESDNEKGEAKALFSELGRRVQKNRPLGLRKSRAIAYILAKLPRTTHFPSFMALVRETTFGSQSFRVRRLSLEDGSTRHGYTRRKCLVRRDLVFGSTENYCKTEDFCRSKALHSRQLPTCCIRAGLTD